MSRIEEALEKAARLRGGLDAVPAVTRPPVPRSPARAKPPVPDFPSDSSRITSPYVVTVTDPHSRVAEEYRKLKTIIVDLTRQEGHHNMIMVTSTIGSEGKSLTSLNLAVTIAQELDRTVLLIDADLRKPLLHSYLGLTPTRGLADCLVDGSDVGEVLIRTGIAKLSLLPAGRTVPNPAELFSSQRMNELVDEMKHRYPDRFIIIDTPPVLPVADTKCLGRLVDGAIMVIREGAASPENVVEAVNALKGTRILGCVYNDASTTTSDNRYHSYYYSSDDTAAREKGDADTGKTGMLRRILGRK